MAKNQTEAPGLPAPAASFLGALGIEVRRGPEGPSATCPDCGASMRVGERGVVCRGEGCRFVLGSVWDFAAWAAFQWDWEALARHTEERWEAGKAAAEWLRRRAAPARLVLQAFLPDASEAGKRDHGRLVAAKAQERSGRHHPFCPWHVARPAGEDELRNLLRLASELSGREIQFDGGPGVMAPLLSSLHEPAGILLLQARRKPRIIAWGDARSAWLGALHWRLDARPAPLAPSPGAWLRMLRSAIDTDETPLPLCLVRLKGWRAPGWGPEQAFSPAPREFGAAAVLAEAAELCGDLRISETGEPLREWAAGEAVRALANGDSERLAFLRGAMLFDDETQEIAAARLARAGRMDLMEALLRESLHRVLERGSQGELARTPAGYEWRDARERDARLVTNFVVKFSHNLMFRESPEIYHCGHAVFAEGRVPIKIDSKALQSPTKLEEAVRSCADPGFGAMPSCFDTGVVNRRLLPCLRREISSLPRKTGVGTLGWSRDRRFFTMPGAVLAADGANRSEQEFRPSVPLLAVYGAAAPERPLPERFPDSARDLVSMLAAMLARGFLKLPTVHSELQGGPEARALAGAVFKGLGQSRPFDAEEEQRHFQEILGSRGYPVLVPSMSKTRLRQMATPLVVFSRSGYRVTESGYDPDEVAGASALALRAVVEWLLVTQGSEFRELRGFRPYAALLKEGRAALKAALDLEEWGGAPVPSGALQALVENAPPGELWRIVGETGDGKARIAMPPEASASDVLVELSLMGVKAAPETGGVVAPLLQLWDLFSSYYGDPELQFGRWDGEENLPPYDPGEAVAIQTSDQPSSAGAEASAA